MLSILIPVYNFDVRKLAIELNNQCKEESISYEIILLDDFSEPGFKTINSELRSVKGIKYIESDKNLGRAKIRNKLMEMAQYKYLLFMDCDSKVVKNNYIKNYINACSDPKQDEILIYGGRVYDKKKPADKNLILHWKYGTSREVIPVHEREKNTNQSFMTNNFLITKSIFQKLLFNENLIGYGHEDTLFGLELKKHNINILHIDNPLMHIGLEDMNSFINKTQEGILNLKRIILEYEFQDGLVNNITLLKYYAAIKRVRIRWLTALFFILFKKIMMLNLQSSNPKLFVFDAYKLGYLCTIFYFR